MSKKSKKSKKKPEVVQATLGEVLEEDKKKSTKKTPKKTTSKKSTKKTPKKAPTKKTTTKKSTKPTDKKKTTSKKSTKKVPTPVEEESQFTLKELPGIGSKTQEKLVAAGYSTVEKISRTRSTTLAKKIEGLSSSGAKKLVHAAKALVKGSSKPVEEKATIEDEAPVHETKLTDIPGVGSKLAKSIEAAGYTSVGRLSRSKPSTVARMVDGLSTTKAESLVAAARDLIRETEIKRIAGPDEIVESTKTVAAPKTIETSKTKEEKPTTKKPVKKKPTAETPKAKAPAKKKPAKKTRKPKKEPAKAPPRPKPKIKRSKSGLPVPERVKSLEVEMKRKWKAAEKRLADPDPELPLQETVQVVSLTRDETKDRIVEVAMEVLNEAMMTGRPAFEIPSRSGDNIVWDEIRDLLLLGMRKISRPYHSLGSVVDATRTARVMEIVFQLLKSTLHATKREVFYSDVNLFRDQKYSDKIIEDVASMLQTTRDSIHVVASARGSAMGRVVIRDGGDRIDLTKMGTGGWAITPFLEQVEILESDAEYILLSEKDAAVMRLSEAKFWNRQPCIVLTGKGSGDIATRAFLKKLVKELEIPAFALVDSDPYGHYIYSVFLRGSKRLSYESPFIATPELKLLGVLSRDLDEYNIPKAVRIPMEPTDIKRVKDMLKEPFVQQNKEWVQDLQLMLRLKEKAEIQAFASHSFQYLTDEYLPRKLETGDWI
ncbi:MAG: helix-hairpin-helix domain-containing protein [Candidatus Thorarchaeota archaeon]